MNTSLTQIIFLLLLGALYLPVIFFAIQRRDDGYGVATWLVAFYAMLALVLNVAEAIWRNGESSQSSVLLLQEIQIYVAFTLITIVMLALQTFLKRETLVGLGWRMGILDAWPCAYPYQCAAPARCALDKWKPDPAARTAWPSLVYFGLACFFHQFDHCHRERKQGCAPTTIIEIV